MKIMMRQLAAAANAPSGSSFQPERGNGEQADPAARANTIMRRAATPAPATSPAKCRNIGCDTTA
jgi:hypothetical protein